MIQISVKKEKAIVLASTILLTVTGYLAGRGFVTEAGILGTIGAAVLTFWSEGINT